VLGVLFALTEPIGQLAGRLVMLRKLGVAVTSTSAVVAAKASPTGNIANNRLIAIATIIVLFI
jgi:hypothetical protein